MARLAILQPDMLAEARLRDALGPEHSIRCFGQWPRLAQALESELFDALVVDPFVDSHPVPVPEIGRMRRRVPEMALVVYGSFSCPSSQLARLREADVDEIVVAGVEDDPARLRRTVEDALARALARRLETVLDGHLSRLELSCLVWAVERADDHPRVPQLAEAFGVSPGSLGRSLRGGGRFSPREILIWSRLLQAARLLAGRETSVERAAHRVGYSTDAALRRAFRRTIDAAPSDVTREGGVYYVLDQLIEAKQRRVTLPPEVRDGRTETP